MTAPCRTGRNEEGETVAFCECPLFQGPIQAGQDDVDCDLDPGLAWSAAYSTIGCSSGGD